MEILVDDGGDDDSGVTVVEAGELGIVTAASEVFDTRLAAANGCDPQGCTAALTRVSFMAHHDISHTLSSPSPYASFARQGKGSFIFIWRLPVNNGDGGN